MEEKEELSGMLEVRGRGQLQISGEEDIDEKAI